MKPGPVAILRTVAVALLVSLPFIGLAIAFWNNPVLFNWFLGLFFVLAVGVILTVLLSAWIRGRQTEQGPAPAVSQRQRPLSFRGTFLILVFPFLAGAAFLLLEAFGQAFARNYQQDLSVKFLEGVTVPITLAGLLTIPLVLREQNRPPVQSRWGSKSAAGFLSLLVIFLVACLPLLWSLGHDLYTGPVAVKGRVEKTDYHQSHVQTYRYVFVAGTRYTVSDSHWFSTLRVGQEIEFLSGPLTKQAYPLP